MIFPGGKIHAQADYKSIFGNDWDKAEAFISDNEVWMKSLAEKYRISYPVAAAVIFPELVRYSALRDKIEITLLKALYINLGDDYADFSIGPFQMKPSFAEKVNEKALNLQDSLRHRFAANMRKDKRVYRSLIVEQLESPESEFLYLICFLKICEESYKLIDRDESFRVKFLSSAYNCGFDKSFDYIKVMSERSFFNTRIYSTKNYPYSDISLYWFNDFTSKQEMRPAPVP
jgi:hypothetical protein